jgi:hypothetical protein
MAELGRKGGLNDCSVNGFAVKREFVDLVAALFLSERRLRSLPLLHSAEL